MLRRRAFAYALAMTAGVISGYFVMEKNVLMQGALFAMTAAGVILTATGMEKGWRIERKRLLLVFASGILIFGLAHADAEKGIVIDGSAVMPDEISFIEGTVVDVTAKDDGWRLLVRDTECGMSEDGSKGSSGNVLVSWYSEELPWAAGPDESGGPSESEPGDPRESDAAGPIGDAAGLIGRRVVCRGKLKVPPAADNPGCFDYRLHLRGKRIRYLFTASSVSMPNAEEEQKSRMHCSGAGSGTVPAVRWRLRRLLFRSRERFLQIFGEDIGGFVRGVIFGDKSGISEEMRDVFNANSTGHLLAVSGLHVGFLYSLIRLLTAGRRDAAASVLTVAVLLLYGEMTMWSASTVRAVMVTGAAVMSVHVRKPFDLLSSASTAALIIMIFRPYQVFDPGFQMSFLALAAIAILAGPVEAVAGKGTGAAVSVQAGAVPVAVHVFHRFNPLSILINIPVIALASIFVPACLVMLVISTAGLPVPRVAVTAVEGLAVLIIDLNERLAADGSFSCLTVSGNPCIPACLTMVFMLLASEWTRIKILRHQFRDIAAALACVLALTLSLGAACHDPFARDEVVFVSVGQGDCTHVRAGSHDILIDGGGNTEFDVGKNILMPYLLTEGAENVELAMVTHLHADHYLGIFQLSGCYPVGAVGIPEEYRESIESGKSTGPVRSAAQSGDEGSSMILPGRIEYISPGTRITLSDDKAGDVYVEPVWPPPGVKRSTSVDDPNENNMVYMVNYRGVRIMVTGDLLEEDEMKMIEYYRGTGTLDCDILKVSHHGSKSSSSEAFLDAASPSIAVIQVGANNFYGHPHEQTLERLEERGIKVYRTDTDGAVGIDIRRGGRIRVNTYIKKTT